MNLQNYKIICKIGRGGFGKVYRVIDVDSHKEYAAKVMISDIDSEESSELIRNLKREISIMLKLSHPSVVRFIAFSPVDFDGNDKPTILTEFMPNGSLEDILKLERNSIAHEYWNDTRKLINIYGIAKAMSYLHSHGIIHRDLKPENILMDKYLFPKVADFGLSKSMEQTYTTQSTQSPKGTPSYIAPEIWADSQYSEASDVYAYSLIVFEIMTNDRPFDNCSIFEILSKISQEKRPEFKTPIPDSYRDLIIRCWAQDPSERPSFNDIVKHIIEDPGFITGTVDENDFLHYVDIISQYKDTFGESNTTFSLDQYVKRESPTFTQVSIDLKKYQFLQKIKENDDSLDKQVKIKENDNSNLDDDNNNNLADDNNNLDKTSLNNLSLKNFNKNMDTTQANDVYRFAVALYNGDGMEADKKRAVRYFKIAADQGNTDAMNKYANMLLKGENVALSYEKAAHYFQLAAEQGNPEAMNSYANMLIKGQGIKQDKDTAAFYYKKASDNNNFNAMKNYGNMLLNGDGVPVNKEEAASYFENAANNDHAYAMYNYGLMLIEGNGVETDVNKGLEYIKKAADNNHFYASSFYADYALHHGMDKPNDTLKYFKIAADNGIADAAFKYGVLLYTGYDGINPNKKKAAKYIKFASDKGIKEAKDFLASKQLEDSCFIC